jgi:hypothetical protein
VIGDLRILERDCCGQKITYVLEREYHARLLGPNIYEILEENYVIRSKWHKNQKRGAGLMVVIPMETTAFGDIFANNAPS